MGKPEPVVAKVAAPAADAKGKAAPKPEEKKPAVKPLKR